jgi:hypothetical protein
MNLVDVRQMNQEVEREALFLQRIPFSVLHPKPPALSSLRCD